MEFDLISFLPNDERTHGARLESEGKEIEGLKHRCCDAACCASSFLDEGSCDDTESASGTGRGVNDVVDLGSDWDHRQPNLLNQTNLHGILGGENPSAM